MSGLSKVIVLDPDVRASRQVQLGFEREGVPTSVAQIPVDSSKLQLPDDDAGLVVVGGSHEGRSLELLRRTRRLLEDAHIDAPIVFAGRGVSRSDAEAAGADEVVLQPAHLRDLVTIGRMLRGQSAQQRTHIVGQLAETTGVFTLVRALSTLGRSAVLTLIRGLRRGEVRFFHGEVTSAQVGLIHGQAALHQLLLWTDARFDFHHEDVVRRQQIPLDRDELFADAERFLAIVRDSSGPLSPSMVLEQDVARIHQLGKDIPTEVHGVLRMFDGHRVLADVLEDSPYRVFETLRVSQRALDVGLLRQATTVRPKATWRAVLAIEEWLVGSEPRDAREGALERPPSESGPLKASRDSSRIETRASRRKRKKRRANTPLSTPAVQTKPDIDWGALVPRILGAEVGPLAGVVPAAHTSGEIQLATREEPRERLEALMDTGKRDRIFPRDIGLEPSVVWDDQADQRAAREAEAVAAARLRDAEERTAREAKARDDLAAEEQRVRAEQQAEQQREREHAESAARRAAESRAIAEAGASRDSAEDLARRLAAARGITVPPPPDRAEVEAKRRAEADADAKARADEQARHDADVKARAEAETTARAEADAKARTEAEAMARADADAKTRIEAAIRAQAEADARAAAEMEAKFRHEADARARTEAEARARAEVDARALAEADAADAAAAAAAAATAMKAKQAADRAHLEAEVAKAKAAEYAVEVARAQAPARAADQARRDTAAAEERAKLDSRPTVKGASRGDSKRTRAAKRDAKRRDVVEEKAIARARAEADTRSAPGSGRVVDVSETDRTLPRPRIELAQEEEGSASELVKQLLVDASIETDHVVESESASATVLVNDRVTVTTTDHTARLTATPVTTVTEPNTLIASPIATYDDPSDGIVREKIAVKSEPVPRSRSVPAPFPAPVDDRPDDATGEITNPISLGELQRASEPSILVADLAVHTAVAMVAVAQTAAPATLNASSPAQERVVVEVHQDVAAVFSEIEEDFFRAGVEKTQAPPKSASDSFDDLDEGYQPVGFWDRLLGRKPPPKR